VLFFCFVVVVFIAVLSHTSIFPFTFAGAVEVSIMDILDRNVKFTRFDLSKDGESQRGVLYADVVFVAGKNLRRGALYAGTILSVNGDDTMPSSAEAAKAVQDRDEARRGKQNNNNDDDGDGDGAFDGDGKGGADVSPGGGRIAATLAGYLGKKAKRKEKSKRSSAITNYHLAKEKLNRSMTHNSSSISSSSGVGGGGGGGDGGGGSAAVAAVDAAETGRLRRSIHNFELFENENWIMQHLRHANIAEWVESYVLSDKEYHLITVLYLGGDISQRIQSLEAGIYSEGVAARYFQDALSALTYMHTNEVVHRSLSMDKLTFVGEARERVSQRTRIYILLFTACTRLLFACTHLTAVFIFPCKQNRRRKIRTRLCA
jgi:hypothetical protein